MEREFRYFMITQRITEDGKMIKCTTMAEWYTPTTICKFLVIFNDIKNPL